MDVGAANPALNRNHVHPMPVKWAKRSTQDYIVEILSSLDDKIDINRQTNQTLEQMAQAIFKCWFVDFEPVRAKAHVKGLGGGCQQCEMAAQAVIAAALPLSAITEENELATLDKNLTQALESTWAKQTDEQKTKLAETAMHFPDGLVESELGEIPVGWEWKKLDSLCEKISKGTTPRKIDIKNALDQKCIPFIKVKDIDNMGNVCLDGIEFISQSINQGTLKRSILQLDDVLFSIAGTIGRMATVTFDLVGANTNQALAFIRLKDKKSFFQICRLNLSSKRIQESILSKIVQGVQANVSLSSLGDLDVIVPNYLVLNDFNKLVAQMFNTQRCLIEEIDVLRKIRDTLLPKLLSGELSVTDMDIPHTEAN